MYSFSPSSVILKKEACSVFRTETHPFKSNRSKTVLRRSGLWLGIFARLCTWYLLTGTESFLLCKYSKMEKTVYSIEYLSLIGNFVNTLIVLYLNIGCYIVQRVKDGSQKVHSILSIWTDEGFGFHVLWNVTTHGREVPFKYHYYKCVNER